MDREQLRTFSAVIRFVFLAWVEEQRCMHGVAWFVCVECGYPVHHGYLQCEYCNPNECVEIGHDVEWFCGMFGHPPYPEPAPPKYGPVQRPKMGWES